MSHSFCSFRTAPQSLQLGVKGNGEEAFDRVADLVMTGFILDRFVWQCSTHGTMGQVRQRACEAYWHMSWNSGMH